MINRASVSTGISLKILSRRTLTVFMSGHKLKNDVLNVFRFSTLIIRYPIIGTSTFNRSRYGYLKFMACAFSYL